MKILKEILKNRSFNDVLSEFNYSDAKPSKHFENKLRNQFLKVSLQKKETTNLFILKRALLLTMLFAIILVSSFGILLYSQTQRESVMAMTLENIYTQSPQAAFMPVFTRLTNTPEIEVREAMNISNIPLNKDFYGSSTTTNITYGPAYTKCTNLFKFDKSISKIITYEMYKDGIYKFKTHVFDQENLEVDIVLFDGLKYVAGTENSSPKFSNTLNNTEINEFIPNKLYSTNETNIIWDEEAKCNGLPEAIQNIVVFNDSNEITSFHVLIKNDKELVYKTEFEIAVMTDNELRQIDSMFDLNK